MGQTGKTSKSTTSRPREFPNWIDAFIDLNKEISPAAMSYIEWAGMFCLSSVVKRSVQFSQAHLKSFRIYPNIYCIFVAEPGEALKSTTAGLAMEILAAMMDGMQVTDPAYVTLGQSSGSHIGIVEDLAKSLDSSVSIISGEFGNLASYTPVETYDFLSHMFDSDKIAEKYTHKTRKKGTEAILRPSVNILGCTTPGWLQENSGYVIGGGFAARVIFIFERKRRFRRLLSKGVGPSFKEVEETRKRLAKDLKRIGKIKGEAKPENKELEEEINEWYGRVDNFKGERGTETFQARKHVHVLRNSMLLSLAERDDLIITREHFHRAKEQIDVVEARLGRGMSFLGKNAYSAMLHEVRDYIEDNQPVERSKIMARFWQEFRNSPSQDLGMILDVLQATGEVTRITIGTKEQWEIKKKKKS